MGLLDGKTALITGAARGIGKAIALRFASEGADIAFTDLVIDENGQKTVAEIEAFGHKVKAYASNAANFDETHQVVADVLAEFGHIDILVNNAGITKDGLMLRMTEAQWDAVLTVNLKSAFNFTHAVTPVMMRQRGGSIINMSSVVGISGHAGLFANATDLAKLASVMLSGGYGEHRFFSRNVMDLFTAPKSETAGNWGLGWWRQGDGQRTWYYGTQAVSDTIGHQGWTGTLAMVDPGRNLVVIYLTNKINSPVTDNKVNANEFDGNWYTASTLGFVPQILSIGMDSDIDQTELLLDLTADMAISSLKLVPEGAGKDHPSVRNCVSKLALFEKEASAWGIDGFKDQADALRRQLEEAFADLPR
jgi:hypothetical protein